MNKSLEQLRENPEIKSIEKLHNSDAKHQGYKYKVTLNDGYKFIGYDSTVEGASSVSDLNYLVSSIIKCK